MSIYPLHDELKKLTISFCDLEKERLKREAESSGREFDLSKAMGEVWRGMTTEEKQPYVDVYNEDKERYSREMAEYEIKKEEEIKNEA